MHLETLFIWKTTRFGLSETCHMVRSLEDLRDLVASELRDRIIYLEARQADAPDEIVSSHLRSSIEDLTDEDFRWLTTHVGREIRGLRA